MDSKFEEKLKTIVDGEISLESVENSAYTSLLITDKSDK